MTIYQKMFPALVIIAIISAAVICYSLVKYSKPHQASHRFIREFPTAKNEEPINARFPLISANQSPPAIPTPSTGIGRIPQSYAEVPMVLHFMDMTQNVMNEHKNLLESCTHHNKDWLFVFWSEADILAFIKDKFPQHFPYYMAKFNQLQRFEIARFMLLFYYGGVYIDLDMHCQKPLLPTLDNFACYIDSARPEFSQIMYNVPYVAMNSAMGCQPGHPFFKRLIEDLLHPKKMLDKEMLKGLPLYLTNMFKAYKKEKPDADLQLLNPSYFSPMLPNFKYLCQNELNKVPRADDSLRTGACQTLSARGFTSSPNSYVSNTTVAIHQFFQPDASSRTFNIRQFKPRVIFYEELTTMGV